jgi:hypothetical protein
LKVFQRFVIKSGNAVIGLAMLDIVPNPNTYTDQFDIEQFTSSNSPSTCSITLFTLDPLYQNRSRLILQELFILTRASLFLHVNHECVRDQTNEEMYGVFVPVRGRRRYADIKVALSVGFSIRMRNGMACV